MKIISFPKGWSKICISVWSAFLVIMFIKPTDAASKQLDQVSNAVTYYDLALQADAAGDYVTAGIYLSFYRQLNPYEYANNIDNQKNIVNARIKFYIDETRYLNSLRQRVINDLSTCQHFPCDQASLSAVHAEVPLQLLPPPSNAVIVCTGQNYTGRCKVLGVGDYINLTQLNINDQISSVMIGSQVKLTLYRHARFDSQSITFVSNDPDLSNNPIDSTYSWSKIASAARVEWK